MVSTCGEDSGEFWQPTLLGLMCIFVVGLCLALCPPLFSLFCVPKGCVWTACLCAIVQTSACILEGVLDLYL